MKKILFVCMMSLIWGLAVIVSEAEAQYAYWYTDVRYVPASRYVDGYSTTYLDYYAGLNYDPAVFAELYRADINETPLDWGYDVGYADIIDAEVYLFSTNYVEGKTYCTSGVHSYIHYLTGQQTVFRRVFPCITIPFPPPSPTPTPPPPTPTPTIAPTPSPSPTPCPQNDLGGVCQIRVISVHITPQTLKPVGTDGGNNTATVSGCLRTGNNMPLPDRQMNLKVYRHLANSDTGGHVDLAHTGSRPVGRLERTSGTTGSDGCFTTKYYPSHIGGIVTIEAFVDSGFYEHKNVLVAVPNLVSLPPGENYGLIGSTSAHPSNHWGTSAAVNGLVQIANDYKVRFYGDNPIPDNAKLHYNDTSLQFGGKFELSESWKNTGAHDEHREGINTDVRCCRDPGNVPRTRWIALNEIFRVRGSTDTHDETGTRNPHWHLRFLFGAPHRRAEKTPHSFVEDAFEAITDRFATQQEWENWRAQIAEAKAQGQSALLEKARIFEQTVFSESVYLAGQRTDAEFVAAVIRAHLFREPTEAESQYWQDYLQNQPPALPVRRKRMNLIYEIEASAEFEEAVLGIVDDAPPPQSTP